GIAPRADGAALLATLLENVVAACVQHHAPGRLELIAQRRRGTLQLGPVAKHHTNRLVDTDDLMTVRAARLLQSRTIQLCSDGHKGADYGRRSVVSLCALGPRREARRIARSAGR